MIYAALILLALSLALFLISNTQRRQAGLPDGRIIYSDTAGWNGTENPLTDPEIGLTGKPDYLVQQQGKIIPVEVKSGRAPEKPHQSHVFQLAAYCYLVEKNYQNRPPYGIVHYQDRDFAIDYTPELEDALMDLLLAMKHDTHKQDIRRSHDQAARCVKCGFRRICDQAL